MPKYTVNLSAKSFYDLADSIKKYRLGLQEKCEELAKQLAEEGVAIAQLQILGMDAVFTGELLDSMNLRKGDVVSNGASYYIYTDCPWAEFVEFGTGIVGSEHPHPDTSIAGWKYDTNNHGEAGWWYYKGNKRYWAKGMPSRPFMYNTAKELKNMDLILHIARRVFSD